MYALNIYLNIYICAMSYGEKVIRKGNKIPFVIYWWDLVWLLDSGAQEEAFYISKNFMFSVFTGIIFIILHWQCPWQCTFILVPEHYFLCSSHSARYVPSWGKVSVQKPKKRKCVTEVFWIPPLCFSSVCTVTEQG